MIRVLIADSDAAVTGRSAGAAGRRAGHGGRGAGARRAGGGADGPCAAPRHRPAGRPPGRLRRLPGGRVLAASGLPTDSILLSGGRRGDDLRRAMRAGAREHLAWPAQAAQLGPAVRAVAEEQQRRQSAAFAEAGDPQTDDADHRRQRRQGRGRQDDPGYQPGAGPAPGDRSPTVLVDLYTQFGDVAMLLNLSPRAQPGRPGGPPRSEVDAALLADHTERHESGLRVLIGAAAPVALDAISAPFLDHVFGLLKPTPISSCWTCRRSCTRPRCTRCPMRPLALLVGKPL